MNKIFIILTSACLFISCKKDRLCICHINVQEDGGAKSRRYEYRFTMKKERVRTAAKVCTHTRTIETKGGKTIATDKNCALE